MFYSKKTDIRSIFCLLVLLITCATSVISQSMEKVTYSVNQTIEVDSKGSAKLNWTIAFSPATAYDNTIATYHNLYSLFRELNNERTNMEIDKDLKEMDRDLLDITKYDAKRIINAKAILVGFSCKKRDRWRIKLTEKENFILKDQNKVFTSSVGKLSGWVITNTTTTTTTYILPIEASDIRVDTEKNEISYILPHVRATNGDVSTDINIHYKNEIMSGLYKIYGDPGVCEGIYWAAKTVIRNTSKSPIYNLKITYKLGEYTEISEPNQYSLVMPDSAIVDLYYPILDKKIAEIKTNTPSRLTVWYEYEDPSGKIHNDMETKDISILGINQFVFSNLNKEEKTENWLDHFNNAPLLASYITKMDEPLTQLTGMIGRTSGIQGATLNDNNALNWLFSAYRMLMANNLDYQSVNDYLTVKSNIIQNVRLPRDLFRDKLGTSLDMAITYAALAESVDLKPYIMLTPGHAFVIIILPSGGWVPIDTTFKDTSRLNDFQLALDSGLSLWKNSRTDGIGYLININSLQNEGRIPCPELKALEGDYLKKIEWEIRPEIEALKLPVNFKITVLYPF